MDFFKYGRGDFFGIIIPGMFLLSNLLFLYQPEISQMLQTLFSAEAGQSGIARVTSDNVIVYALYFALSYAIGFAIRFISPNYLNKLSSFLGMFFIPIKAIFNGNSPENTIETVVEDYPYMNYNVYTHFRYIPDKVAKFYRKILKTDFKGKIRKMNNREFINFCKDNIISRFPENRAEILFYEGTVRFLSGICYSFIICALLYYFRGCPSYFNINVINLYLLLLIALVIPFNHFRHKEVITIMNIYYSIRKDADKK
ncbi:MAG: hypothetical protein A2Y33_15835 [Spirochaetes bacterium GWF1_51_8]|nr:MAG: hypothetical protein A2Y33_15835 [Spirochaetes bacterium GWF1_51_8]